jgi:hypothetical protein
MVTIQIPEALAQQLEAIAQQENRSLDEIATELLEEHLAELADDLNDPDFRAAIRERYREIREEEANLDPKALLARLRKSADFWDEELSK